MSFVSVDSLVRNMLEWDFCHDPFHASADVGQEAEDLIQDTFCEMPAHQDEIKRRELAARAALQIAYKSADDEFGVALFVSHHLDEIDSTYWRTHFSMEKPDAQQILESLVLKSHWGGDDEMETFDFTLPGDVTNYVICVRFNESGEIDEIAMES